jgi:hypothetical protein
VVINVSKTYSWATTSADLAAETMLVIDRAEPGNEK